MPMRGIQIQSAAVSAVADAAMRNSLTAASDPPDHVTGAINSVMPLARNGAKNCAFAPGVT